MLAPSFTTVLLVSAVSLTPFARPAETASAPEGGGALAAAVALSPPAALDRSARADRSWIHTRLESSEPADGDSIAAPERVRLVYNNPVNAALSRARLVGEDGTEWILEIEAGEAPEVLVATAPALSAGSYRLEWRVVSADGHAVSGEFSFHIVSPAVLAESAVRDPASSEPAPDSAAVPAGAAPAAADVAPGGASGPGADGSGQSVAHQERFPTALAILRGLATGSLMALAGLLAFIVWITPGTTNRTIALTRILAVIAPLLLAVHLGAWIRSTAPPGGLDLSWVRAVLGGTGTGRAESTRFLCGLAALIALWRRHEGTAAILTLTAVGMSGAIGHALAVDRMVSVPAKSGHLLASALWLGGLLVLATARGEGPEFLSQVRRVSAVALASVVVIAFTGLVQAVILLPGPEGLIATTYGRAVLAKIGGLAILIAFGARNRRFLIPRLAEGAGPGALQRSCALETWVMFGVILLAGFLSYIPLPE